MISFFVITLKYENFKILKENIVCKMYINIKNGNHPYSKQNPQKH